MADERGLVASYPFAVPAPEQYQPRNEERFRAQMAQANAEIFDRLANIETNIASLARLVGGIPVPAAFPSGAIVMWSGAIVDIPAGWGLCDGSDGTPDLLDRFIVGAGSAYDVDDTGGADTVSLTTADMPAHDHPFSATTGSGGSHTHGIRSNHSSTGVTAARNPNFGLIQDGASGAPSATDPGGAHTHSVSGTTGLQGGGAAHENRPPYYALAYIMKL